MSNVLLVMADQHVPHASGPYGSTVVRTPHLDGLAQRGTTFDNAYCNSPICVPSRAAMATGRYVHTTGNWDNAAPYVGTEAASWGHRVSSASLPLVTFGKLHYRRTKDPTGFPDQRLPLHVRGGQGDLTHILRGDQPALTVLRKAVLSAAPGESEYTRYDRSIAEAAADWLTGDAPTLARPWACMVSFVTPHYPLVVPQRLLDLYPQDTLPLPTRCNPEDWDRHPALERARRLRGFAEPLTRAQTLDALQAYCGLVTFMDEQVGVVLGALEASGQAQDTLVLYVSDHGELAGTDGLWFKGTMQEPSVRIPAIVAGPGVPHGARCETAVSLVDVFPTITSALGVPDNPADRDLTGTSLVSIANSSPQPDRVVFSEYHSSSSVTGSFMVRFGSWKYVYHCDLTPQLFNLSSDPTESRDLAPDPEYAEQLQAAHTQLLAICDPMRVDEEIRADQRRRVAAAGGAQAVIATAPEMAYSPAPRTMR